MTEPTAATLPSFLSEVFRKSLSDALSRASATDWNVTVSDDQARATEDSSLWYGLTASGAVNGSAAIQLRAEDALQLAQKLLKETEPAAELNPNHKQSIATLFGKVSEQFAKNLQSLGFEITSQIGPIEAPRWRGPAITLAVSETTPGSLTIMVQFDADMLASISAQPPRGLPAEASPSVTKPQVGGDNNLDLLLGVDLNLTLRFGQRTLTLREIMDLSSGSIIELDRQVQEPADLLLGDKLIARGEVVVVDGNYGLRITELAEPVSDGEKMLRSAV